MSESVHLRPGRAAPPAIRVVHVLNSFGLGGMEKGIATCIRRSSPAFSHVVLCLTRTGAAEALLPPGVDVIEMHKPTGNSIRFLWRLANRLRTLRPCLVHTRNWGGIDGIIAARLAGVRGILHGDHGWDVDDLHGNNRRRRRVRRTLSGFTEGFTCVSKDIERWLREEVRIRCPVRQIYNGVDAGRYLPSPGDRSIRDELGLEGSTPVVCHVGRLVRVKDHATLFAAFARVRERCPDAVLLCVGEGPEEQELRRSAGPGVLLLGHRTDIPEILRASDVFVSSSLNEGISNTILEAMATGLPVVATIVGGNVELVARESTGSLVPPQDPAGLADALTRYLRDADLRLTHGGAARRLVESRFSVAAMVRAYEDEWRGCHDRSRRRQPALPG